MIDIVYNELLIFKHVPISNDTTWRRHQMETFSTLLALYEGDPPVIGEFPSHSPITRSFDGFFHEPEHNFEQTIETPVI